MASTITTTTTTTTTHKQDDDNNDEKKNMNIINPKKKIIVCTFTPSPYVYSICPFAIKLESFLRINKINYETKFVNKAGPKGMIPWIILKKDSDDNGDENNEICDSNVIIGQIKKELLQLSSQQQQQQEGSDKYYDCSESNLTKVQIATTHMLIRMLEEHLAQIGFYYRYGLHMEEFVNCLDVRERFPSGSAELFLNIQPDITQTKTSMRGLTRHTNEEIWDFANDDIQMISDLLGENKYVFGDNHPSLVDCAIFGHLSQFLYIPMDFPQKQYINENCPNIIQFMDNFRNEVWPDWDELCNTKVDWSGQEVVVPQAAAAAAVEVETNNNAN